MTTEINTCEFIPTQEMADHCMDVKNKQMNKEEQSNNKLSVRNSGIVSEQSMVHARSNLSS
jgi:hypothetical protein